MVGVCFSLEVLESSSKEMLEPGIAKDWDFSSFPKYFILRCSLFGF